jgi:2-aminoadipate transaminase
VSIPWNRLLAERTAWIRPSLLVDFERLPSSADLILFSGGAPPLECLPVERIAGALAEAWHAEPEALWYGESQGHEPLRVLIAERMRQRGAAVEPDEVIITNGSQQGIDLIARLLLEPGDRVIVEAPTYFGALQVFEPFDARISTVPVDEHGMVIEALERELASAPRPKLIYTVPTFQNPTGVTLDPERRAALVALAERYGVPIVEDDPYGELWFDRPPPPPLRALHPDVLYLGTFSKTLAPGLRIGWLVAPRRLMKLLVDAKEGADIQADRLLQRALARVLEGAWFERHLEAARANYRERCALLLRCLERELAGLATWTAPGGGFFVWGTLPDGVDTDALLVECARQGVAYIPGSAFYPDRAPRPSFRLGFTTLSPAELEEGIARLGRAIRAAVQPSLA